MSEFGIKIKNYEAGSLYDYSLGVRSSYDYTNAMLTNSLFSDFLRTIGLKEKNGSTRDIICIEFNYGSRSYEDEIKHLEKHMKTAEGSKLQKLKELKQFADDNQDKYCKKSKEEIRTIFYKKGVDIVYQSKSKTETIHYKMLYRTPGKAKKGSCMFIRDKLYDKAHNFLYMGIELPMENSPIVEMGAYSSLITSSIVGKVTIQPEEILVVEDVDRFFKTKIISVETDENKHCIAKAIDDYELKNTLFDGQALIDESIFPDWGEGYILLRHHLCKMAAFSTNIQTFFKDYFGDKYETAKVKDMFGKKHYAKDIKLITTDNAMKWLKFDVSYKYWLKWVKKNGCEFGIVKTAHKSKLGEVQRMSYQMINALDMEIMPEVVQCSMDYIRQLKTDDDVFLEYLEKNANFSNDYEVLVALVKQNRDFLRSEYFRSRKAEIIRTYVLNFKNGKIIQNADNLVIVGSPYAMLLHAAGASVDDDDTFCYEEGTIQCYTERFADGEYLAEFRSPFNAKHNMGYLHNVYDERFKKYFNFGEQIIAVNMIGTDAQSRNNGADQDSDSLYVTNQPQIVDYAKYCYLNYPTIENNIPKEKNTYSYSMENFAAIDNNLAAAQLAIGESSNLAQVCLTYTYNFEDQKYMDYVCILSVLAQVAIDNAKRRFDIDLTKEIALIKEDMEVKKHGYPMFWGIIRKDFNKNRINPELQCPMNYIFSIIVSSYNPPTSTLPMSHFFIQHEMQDDRRKCKKVEELIWRYSLDLYNSITDEDDDDTYLLLRSDYNQLIGDIRRVKLSSTYAGLFSWLLNRAFVITGGAKSKEKETQSNIRANKSLLIKTLYDTNPKVFLSCFTSKNEEI